MLNGTVGQIEKDLRHFNGAGRWPAPFLCYTESRSGGRNWLRPRGFWMDNSACEHREIIDEYAAKGWRYVGYLPTMFSGEGGTKEVDLIFEREEP